MKLAVFGSCVSRDAVRYLPPGIELVSYIARSSIVSAVHAEPYLVTDEIPESFGAFEGRMVRHDLEKTGLSSLAGSDPDVVVIDLIDERFRVYEFAGTLVTLSHRISKEQFGSEVLQKGKVITRDNDFPQCARVMLDRISFPKTKILINEAYWAERYLSGEDQLTYDNAVAIRRNNDQLRRYYDAFRGLLPEANFIRYDGALLADPGNVWGPAPYHFTANYYEHIARKIAEIGFC